MLKENDKVNIDIELTDTNNETIKLKDLLSQKIVLYFYPKDLTPGCTTEACEFRDFNKDITDLGYKVIGVSSDDHKSHLKFIDKHNLNFDLFSDSSHNVQEHFGVWVEKSMYGKKYMGTQRSTFILDTDGTILKVFEKAKSSGHAKEVFEYLKSLDK